MIAIFTLTTISISFLISFIIGKKWIKKTKEEDIILNAEALRNPINIGITVAGFLLPIIVGIITFASVKTGTVVNKDIYLFSSIILIILSIFFGLWNNYSLATLTDAGGKFKITKAENTTFPAFFVFQLSILFFGIILLGIFGFSNMDRKVSIITEDIKSNSSNDYSISILKSQIQISTHKNLLLDLWGEPNEIRTSDTVKTFIYWSTNCDFTYTIKHDTIININQKTKK